MSAPTPAGGGAKPWLIGAGIGCGCLSLAAVAIVIVIILIGAASHSGGQAQGPRPGTGQGPAPGPGGSPGPGGLQILVQTVRVDQNNHPVQPADVFQTGEVVGAVVKFVAVPQATTIGTVWLQIDGERGTPAAPPRTRQIAPDQAGQALLWTLGGATPGHYAFVVFLPGAGDQIQAVATQKFEVR